MAKIEFYNTPEGNVYYKLDGGEARRLTRFCKDIIDPMLLIIENNFSAAYSELQALYPRHNNSESAKLTQRYMIVERFVRCNFGEYDLLTNDYENGILQFEMVHCPLRGGHCPYENKICNPRGKNVKLSKLEHDVASLYINGVTFKEIASRLQKKPNTIKTVLNRMKNKLCLKNSRALIRDLRLNNII